MAENMYKAYTKGLTREIEVGANVPGGTIGIEAASGLVYVTLGDSGGSKVTQTSNLPGNITSITFENGGAGFREESALCAFDGSWLFPVQGVTNGETVPDSAAGTNRGTKVYIDDDGALSLTATDNTYVGIIDDGNIVGGIAPVQIGVSA